MGFVPTMGALHLGHASLLERARSECDQVVASIYVNPTQFAPGEDYESYPRTLEEDLVVCRSAGVDVVWLPQTQDMYPDGCETIVKLEVLGHMFEGVSRPHHFQGVATVVTKLFLATKCHKAFFGEKDLQQLFVIRRMVRDLLFNIDIVGVPTAREAHGLARSSRNEYLSESERARAGAIYRALTRVKESFAQGNRAADSLREIFLSTIQDQLPAAEVERCDLFDATLSKTLGSDEDFRSGYCAVAVKLGKVRLIDNISLCS